MQEFPLTNTEAPVGCHDHKHCNVASQYSCALVIVCFAHNHTKALVLMEGKPAQPRPAVQEVPACAETSPWLWV